MTAIERFYAAVPEGTIPVAFPIASIDGDTGLAGQGVPFLGNPEAEAMTLSRHPRNRATVAVMAIHFARTQVVEHYEGIRVS